MSFIQVELENDLPPGFVPPKIDIPPQFDPYDENPYILDK